MCTAGKTEDTHMGSHNDADTDRPYDDAGINSVSGTALTLGRVRIEFGNRARVPSVGEIAECAFEPNGRLDVGQ